MSTAVVIDLVCLSNVISLTQRHALNPASPGPMLNHLIDDRHLQLTKWSTRSEEEVTKDLIYRRRITQTVVVVGSGAARPSI